MLVFPNAKINLGLYVMSKREDGYHTINSCLYPISWCDALEVLPSKVFSFHNTGLSIDGNIESNICVKAYNLLKEKYDLPPVQLHLHKVIPMGAGLGGGSSNGAFMLKVLNELFKLKLDTSTLTNYASLLGSDCSFFIENKPTFVSGRGDKLDEIDIFLKGKWIIVVYPNVHSSTKEAYEGLDLRYLKKRIGISEILKESISNWKDHLTNDFEKTIFSKHPVLSEIKNQLYTLGATYASMSGSGSSIYGIFDKEINLKNSFPKEYSIWAGELT